MTNMTSKQVSLKESQRDRDAPLSHPLQNGQTAIKTHFDTPKNMDIEDDYIRIYHAGFYGQNIHPWRDWQPDNLIATLSGPAESGPLLQMQDPTDRVSLYEFKLTAQHTLTISTQNREVESAWRELAKTYGLHCGDGKDFKLVDVICFLQTGLILPIGPQEVAALKECVKTVAMVAVKRLEHPNFALMKDRSPVLQCELTTFTLCLRKDIEEQSVMLILVYLNNQQSAWIYGRLFQVMTTPKQTAVDVSVIFKRDDQQATSKYQILHHISELNMQGAYFDCEGLGNAGELLMLPKEARPLPFQPVHIP